MSCDLLMIRSLSRRAPEAGYPAVHRPVARGRHVMKMAAPHAGEASGRDAGRNGKDARDAMERDTTFAGDASSRGHLTCYQDLFE